MIELKITSDTAAELAKHLAELAGGFLVVPEQHDPVMPEVAEAQAAEAPKRTRRTKEQIAADNAAQGAAVEQEAGEPTGAGATDAQPEESTAPTPATAAPEKVAPQPTDTALDFDKDVAPVVLGYVKSKGKPWVVAILNQFGVERASELPPEQFGELVDTLHAEAAE